MAFHFNLDLLVKLLNKVPGLQLIGLDTSEGWQNLKQNFSLVKFLTAVLGAAMAVIIIATMVIGAISIEAYPYTRPQKLCVTGKTKWQLASTVVPTAYNLKLTPALVDGIFAGELVIDINVVSNATTCVQFHAKDLNLFRTQLLSQGKVINPRKVSTDNETDIVTATFDDYLPVGAQQLSINYEANINNEFSGFFRSGYVDPVTKAQKYVYATQFEAVKARRAYPCFDDPSLKATFRLSVNVDKDDMAGAANFVVLSNTELIGKSDTFNGKVLYTFKQTPVMSTYNFAWAMGDFALSTYNSTLTGVSYRLWSIPSLAGKGAFSLSSADFCTNFYTTYFGIAYPFRKMDLVALPDFSGAMENWGMATFKDSLIMLDDSSTQEQKQAAMQVVCHEVAHSWAGNLVTAAKWADIWLNEGITTFYEFLALDFNSPNWNAWNTFYTNNLYNAMNFGAFPSSHPLQNSVTTQSQIEGIFDTVAYNKGAAVLRMLYHRIGADVFRQWMQTYLNLYAYSSATTDQLWDVLVSVMSGIPNAPTKKLLNTWVTEPGYPVITLEPSMTTANSYYLSQKRFLYPSNSPLVGHKNARWWVPASMVSSSGSAQDITFYTVESDEFTISGNWVKINAGQKGYYRVNYPLDMWAQLAGAIHGSSPALSNPLDRYGIVDDAFALARVGMLPIEVAFNITESIAHDTSYEVWQAAIKNVNFIGALIYDTSSYGNYKKFVRDFLYDVYGYVGWTGASNEAITVKQLRNLVLTTAIRYGDLDVIATGVQIFQSSNGTLPVEIRSPVFRSVVRASEQGYTTIMNKFRNSPDAAERRDALLALGSSTFPYLLTDALHLSLDSGISTSDALDLLQAVSINSFGRLIAWDFAQEHWSELVAKLGRDQAMKAILPLTQYFSTMGKYQEVQQFFNINNPNGDAASLQQYLDVISSNAQFLAKSLDPILSWVNTNYGSGSSSGL